MKQLICIFVLISLFVQSNSSHCQIKWIYGHTGNLKAPLGFFTSINISQLIGFYIDYKFNTFGHYKADDDYIVMSVQTAEDVFGDLRIGTSLKYDCVDFGITITVTPYFIIYSGAGYYNKSVFYRYYHYGKLDDRIDKYWINDNGSLNKTGINLNSGIIYIAGKLYFQLGYDNAFKSMAIGLGTCVFF